MHAFRAATTLQLLPSQLFTEAYTKFNIPNNSYYNKWNIIMQQNKVAYDSVLLY